MPPDSDTPPLLAERQRQHSRNSVDAGIGWRILGTWKGAIYIRSERPTPIDGGCCCAYCKTHPKEIPAWDTMVVPTRTSNRDQFTYTVHMPDVAEFYANVRREKRRA